METFQEMGEGTARAGYMPLNRTPSDHETIADPFTLPFFSSPPFPLTHQHPIKSDVSDGQKRAWHCMQ
jgi:hypothetical protein